MSRNDIQNKIERLEIQIYNLNTEKKSYQSSLKYAENLVNNLKKCNDYLEKTEVSLDECYTKAGKRVKYDDIKSIEDNIADILNQLNTAVLANINIMLSRLSRNIDRKNEEIRKLWNEYYSCKD